MFTCDFQIAFEDTRVLIVLLISFFSVLWSLVSKFRNPFNGKKNLRQSKKLTKNLSS